MSLPAILDKYRTAVDAEIKDIIENRPEPLYRMMGYHFGWIDEKGNPLIDKSGKALRPALCLFCCEAVGGDTRVALPAAAALELVHNFSLIHDDIQDDDRERRHRPTVWAVWGKAQAINVGTAMRILANTALLRLSRDGVSLEKQHRLNELLDEISLKLIEGQYLDIDFESRFDIKVADYLDMIGGKTAALISGSMAIGASLGTSQDSYVDKIGDIGSNLGLAFQIRDDILGIWGNEKETGKSSGNDIRRHKKSFPVVYALEHLDEVSRQELISLYQGHSMDDKTVSRVLEIFDSVDTKTNSQKVVDRYCTLAAQAFNSMPLPQLSKNEMSELIEFLIGRSY